MALSTLDPHQLAEFFQSAPVIDRDEVLDLMQSPCIEIQGVVCHEILRPGVVDRIQPPLTHAQAEDFLRRYFTRCLAEDPQGDWSESRYGAMRAAASVIGAAWARLDETRKSQWKSWMSDLYRQGDPPIREALETGLFEHLFASREIAAYCRDWEQDSDLGPAYRFAHWVAATLPGVGHGNGEATQPMLGVERILYNSYFIPLEPSRCFLRFDVDVRLSMSLSQDMGFAYRDGAIYFHHSDGRCFQLSDRWNGLPIHVALDLFIKAVADPVVMASMPRDWKRRINAAAWTGKLPLEDGEIVLASQISLNFLLLVYQAAGKDYAELFYKTSVRQQVGFSIKLEIHRQQLLANLLELRSELLQDSVFDNIQRISFP